jgi:hypothetical protein
MNWHGLVSFVGQNKLALALLATAAIVTMPEPGSEPKWETLYRWIFDCAHQYLNMKRPTLPADRTMEKPAQPKP